MEKIVEALTKLLPEEAVNEVTEAVKSELENAKGANITGKKREKGPVSGQIGTGGKRLTLRTGDGSMIVFKPKMVRSEFEAMKARIERGQIDRTEMERTADRSLRSLSRSIIE